MYRFLVAAAAVSVFATVHHAAGQSTRGRTSAARRAPAADPGGASVTAWPFSRNTTTPSTASPAKRRSQRSVEEKVLSPFDPPPDPRKMTARSRTPSGATPRPDPRRSMDATQMPQQSTSNPSSRSPWSRYNAPSQGKPLARSGDPNEPRTLPPTNRGGQYNGSRSGQSQSRPQAMPYDRRPRTSNQPLDQQTARDQLRAMQQERMNRDAARWRSEQQTKRNTPAPTPNVDRQPLPTGGSEPPSTELDNGPALFAPSNGK